jgi:hypothetical protein
MLMIHKMNQDLVRSKFQSTPIFWQIFWTVQEETHELIHKWRLWLDPVFFHPLAKLVKI